MSRAVTRWTYLGLTVLLVGLLVAGSGAATHLEERRCAAAGVVSVVPTAELDGSPDGYDRVDFEELTAEEQRVFRSVRSAGGQALTDRDAIREAVVSYENETYLVAVATASGSCTPWDRERVLVPLVAGLVVSAVGLVLVRGREHD
ncbi:hypothetical protein [Halosegnis sp.]|uniref:hypothetical protein n=1 Tax=Halosegnis sp. TaxID=2864959 RepID=UPI0035D4015F